jgi:tetratricopeptide (TPR) repeat protein
MIWLAKGDAERTAREVSQALDAAPDFALAHVTLAALHLSQGERDKARAELDKAQTLDPRLPALALTWSQFYASSGDTEQAIAEAQRAAQERPKDPQPHLLLGRIYQQASRMTEMRNEARTVLALAPEAQKARMRSLVERLLGESALDDSASAPEVPANQPGAVQAAPSGSGTGAEPHLTLGAGGLPRPGTLNPGGGPSTLRLQQPGGKLRLDLSK